MSCSQRSLELEADIWGAAPESKTSSILREYTKEWIPRSRILEIDFTSQSASTIENFSVHDSWKIVCIDQTIQSQIEHGEIAVSCAEPKIKMMYKWSFQTS